MRSHAQHRPARRGGSDSQRERRELGVTPRPTTQQDTAKRKKERSQRRKEERKERTKRGKRKERSSKADTNPHTHTRTPGGGARNKNKRQERLPQLPPDARPEPNTNRSRNGKNQPAGTVTLAEPFKARAGGAHRVRKKPLVPPPGSAPPQKRPRKEEPARPGGYA